MTTIPLLFDPKESLEILKYQYPDFWEVDIIGPKLAILTQVNSYSISHSKALNNCIADCKTMADRILVMAAYQYIMDQKALHYRNACGQIAKIRIQQIHLAENKVISGTDKAIIDEFYCKRLGELETIRRNGLESPELCRHLQVQFDAAEITKPEKS